MHGRQNVFVAMFTNEEVSWLIESSLSAECGERKSHAFILKRDWCSYLRRTSRDLLTLLTIKNIARRDGDQGRECEKTERYNTMVLKTYDERRRVSAQLKETRVKKNWYRLRIHDSSLDPLLLRRPLPSLILQPPCSQVMRSSSTRYFSRALSCFQLVMLSNSLTFLSFSRWRPTCSMRSSQLR